MKKRKIKLFASVASLAMVAAVMGVGVWAATSQSVNITSTVGFTATGIEGTVALQVAGNPVNTATASNEVGDVKTASKPIATFALADTQDKVTNVAVTIDLKDATGDGFFSAEDGTITYTLTFANTSSTGVGMFYTITTGENKENWKIEGAVATATDVAATPSATITFTYIGEKVSSITAGQEMPDITINLASTAAALGAQG